MQKPKKMSVLPDPGLAFRNRLRPFKSCEMTSSCHRKNFRPEFSPSSSFSTPATRPWYSRSAMFILLSSMQSCAHRASHCGKWKCRNSLSRQVNARRFTGLKAHWTKNQTVTKKVMIVVSASWLVPVGLVEPGHVRLKRQCTLASKFRQLDSLPLFYARLAS